MKIHLKNNSAFQWYSSEETSFKGYFYEDNIFYEKENALHFFDSIQHQSYLEKTIRNLNGIFTLIKKIGSQTFLYSDITRSFPIFYTHQKDKLYLSDDIYFLKSKFNINNFDSLSEIELKASNHTHGKKTLLAEVFQIQASELITFKKEEVIKKEFLFSYAIKNEISFNISKLKKNTANAFKNSFQRLINSLKEKTVIIPLSSGFDSRLIATIFKKNNYNNVICYTYGSKNSFEIEKSKKTAKQLGFKWHFIEYNKDLIGDFLNTTDFKSYIQFAGKLSSMPNLQEYFAVKYLKKNKLIPDNAIFIPGYAGDILGGSEYFSNIPAKVNHNQIAAVILDKKMKNYHFNRKEKKQALIEIKKNIKLFDTNYRQKIAETVLDDYNLKERIAKYIFNSANFYSFFGYEFRFPFWDKELLDFFKTLPLKHKQNKQLFNDVLIDVYFKPFNVYFETKTQIQPKKNRFPKIKKQIKPFLPTFIKEKIIARNSWTNYKIITQQMLLFLDSKNIKVKRTYNDYNEIITQWYVYISKKGFD